jgi:GntR family transcriptional regulator
MSKKVKAANVSTPNLESFSSGQVAPITRLEKRLQGLQRFSASPLYEQLTDRLRQHVSAQEPGGQMPTEEELVEMFGVSRSTVRKAIQRLVDESVLMRRQGMGTFVSQPIPKIVHSLDRLAPFMETFRQLGENIKTQVIEFNWIEHPDLPAELDGWERPVLGYQRLYVSRGVPHAITRIRVPIKFGRRMTREDVDSAPIYDILTKLNVRLAHAEFLVSCRQPLPEISEALEISQSSYLLVLDRITRDQDGEPVEMTTHFLRPDVYQLSVGIDTAAAVK